ncbi:HET-domain-containing protein [Coniochaeta sp. PMI_546]|nr:HET-domain-containing protein [Coniochaeta sp. PMI_546]
MDTGKASAINQRPLTILSLDEAIAAYIDIFGQQEAPEPVITDKKKSGGFLRRSGLFGKSKASAAPQTPQPAVQRAPPKNTGSLLDLERFDIKVANAARRGQGRAQASGTSTSSPGGLSMVLTQHPVDGHVYALRNFYNGASLDVESIVQACHATCAVPFILGQQQAQDSQTAASPAPMSRVSDDKMNPVDWVITETRGLFPNRKIGVVVSIGCGAPSSVFAERSSPQWGPALAQMASIYAAAEKQARMMDAQQDLLDWTNYYRFTLGQALSEVSVDECQASTEAKAQFDKYLANKSRNFKDCAGRLELYSGDGWRADQASPTKLSMRIVRAILDVDLLTTKRLAQNTVEFEPEGGKVFRGFTAKVIFEAALDIEEQAKIVWGPNSEALWRAVEVTEWLRTFYDGLNAGLRTWTRPADPQRHSAIRHPPPQKLTQKQLTRALVPCHTARIEEVTFVLDNHFDVVFSGREKTEWLWGLASRTDSEVQTGLWLWDVDDRSRKVSSDVLQLIASRLRRRFPDGPWAATAVPESPQDVWIDTTNISAPQAVVPQRTDQEVDVDVEKVRIEYAWQIPPSPPASTGQPDNVYRVSGHGSISDALRGAHITAYEDPRPDYQYSKLPGGNFTRLINLHPSANAEDPLVCDLDFLDLDHEPYSYDAVSYVWGEPRFIKTLKCGQKILLITATLASALRRFRSQTVSRRLWVDAVCINQQDVAEKTRQVRNMALIYERARSCVVYLGDRKPGQEKYMYFLLRLAELVETMGEASVVTNRNNKLIDQAMTEAFGARNNEAINDIASIPWFQRRWIIQEASLCRAAVVFLGPSMANMDHIAVALTAILNSNFVTQRTFGPAILNLQVINYVRNHRKRYPPGTGGYGIVDLLINCHSANCSEPRDRIFALLSMAPDVGGSSTGSIKFPVNYREFLLETYTVFALQCLRASPTLDILHCAGAFKPNPTFRSSSYYPDNLMGFPSFVPDWSATRRYVPLMDVTRFTAGLTGATPQRIIEPDRLILPGLILDSVRAHSDGFSRALTPEDVPVVMGSCILAYKKFMSPGGSDPKAYTGEIPLEKISRTLIADHALLDSTLFLKTGAPRTAERTKSDQERAHSRRLALWVGLSKFVEEHQKHGRYDFLQQGESRDTLLELQYAKALSETMHGRVLIMSQKGWMGIAPQDVQAGDLIVVLLGLRTPFILRASSEAGESSYRIIGDCYVDGFMEGEAFKLRSLQQRDFVIV